MTVVSVDIGFMFLLFL